MEQEDFYCMYRNEKNKFEIEILLFSSFHDLGDGERISVARLYIRLLIIPQPVEFHDDFNHNRYNALIPGLPIIAKFECTVSPLSIRI